jgi:hypothetical protein
MSVRVCIYIYIYCTQGHTYTHTHTYIHACVWAHIAVRAYLATHLAALGAQAGLLDPVEADEALRHLLCVCVWFMSMAMYVCMYLRSVYTHTYEHTHTHTHTHTHLVGSEPHHPARGCSLRTSPRLQCARRPRVRVAANAKGGVYITCGVVW